MLSNKQKRQAERIARFYGCSAQLAQAAQEFAEAAAQCTRVLLAHQEGPKRVSAWDKLANEMADVHVMMEQLLVLSPGLGNRVAEYIAAKLTRQDIRVETLRAQGQTEGPMLITSTPTGRDILREKFTGMEAERVTFNEYRKRVQGDEKSKRGR